MLPLGLTIYLLFLIMIKVNSMIISVTPRVYHQYMLHEHYGVFFRFMVLLIIIFVIAMFGALTKMFIGRKMLKTGDRLINRIPVMNKIYKGIKQISGAVFGSQSAFLKKLF